jgi:hypothetical protein
MSIRTRVEYRSKAGHGRVFHVEVLEQRALLAAAVETFNGPSLSDLIQLALRSHHPLNTAPAAINRMVSALEEQLESGPLADFQSGKVTGPEFLTEVKSLETSYEENAADQLLPRFPNVDRLIDLQGQRIVADITSLNQQNVVQLIQTSTFKTDAAAVIESLTGGPIFALHTPASAFVTTTQNFETNLNTIVASLSATAVPKLTLAQVNTTIQTAATAYLADMNAGLLLPHPNIAAQVQSAVNTLQASSTRIAQQAPTNAQSQLQDAITTFDNALLDLNGLFGPEGPIFGRHKHDSD